MSADNYYFVGRTGGKSPFGVWHCFASDDVPLQGNRPLRQFDVVDDAIKYAHAEHLEQGSEYGVQIEPTVYSEWLGGSVVSETGEDVTALLVDALSALGGVTITVRHELEPASQQLMDTLGVTVIVDSANGQECERVDDRTGERYRCRRCARVERELRGEDT